MTTYDEIRARCEKATPGPWYWSDDEYARLWNGAGHLVYKADWRAVSWTNYESFGDASEADAAFIAAARQDVPLLLRALELAVETINLRLEPIDQIGPDEYLHNAKLAMAAEQEGR